ncbi:pilus assembly protein TadG-related protein [Vibrio renipiscarius]|uniref:TadE/TadG family type IV pilus assembly protein n=1 Tax=Vibrio renipiscarius TaxID=1461322 RepID=UPI00354D4B87
MVSMTRSRNQRGHASILFVMIVPVLFGVFMLGSDGARALQQKARMQDATEAAALAISAHADPNESDAGNDAGSAVNQTIATDFISAYFPNENINSPSDFSRLKITRKSCEQIADCTPEGHRFFQYDIQASLKYDTWFPGNDAIVGFGEQLEVSGTSIARKYQSHSIDVVLAADFSGSMDDGWYGGQQRKYQDLLDIINSVANELDKFNDLKIPNKTNMIGIAPYNHYARRKTGDERCDKNNTIINGIGNVEHLSFNNKSGVRYSKTINEMKKNAYAADNTCAVDQTSSRGANFYSIPLTKNMFTAGSEEESFTARINRFSPKGGTASYLGLIEAYKILKEGTNKKKLLVILSDGVDTPSHTPIGEKGPVSLNGKDSYATIGEKLVKNAKLCEEIKTELSENETDATLYLIGFDYKQGQTNEALDSCVGRDNILYAQNKNEILNKILSLIAEEIGHLK